ncbi:Uncharacterised protein [Staphylococcus aureus]|nr:Uncharacterised protein [Staphylococcus aureus]
MSLTATILIYGFTASESDFSKKIGSFFGSFPALVATPLLITAISTSDKARAVCCASTAVIFKCFGFDVISFTVPANPKSFFSFIKPAASNSLSARAWFDTSFGMTTLAPSLTFLISLILSE